MKPTIEIISHCWAKKLTHYAGLLCYQWSSFLLHKPTACNVLATAVTSSDDPIADGVISWFMQNTPLSIRQIVLPPEQIGRRSIGRNTAALNCRSDIVWFADADYVFGPGCLDALASLDWPNTVAMVYPGAVQIQKDWKQGDEYVKGLHLSPKLVEINPDDFQTEVYSRAIGGVQIVKGTTARHGYLSNSQRYQTATKKPFRTTEDIHYRKEVQSFGSIARIQLPGVFRLRHTENAYEGKRKD